MIVYLNNTCGAFVEVCINNTLNILMKPHGNNSITCDSTDDIIISVRPRKKSKFKGGIYNLILESKYVFCNTSENIELFIAREKIRVSLNVSYERMFLSSPKSDPVSEVTRVTDEDRMKKRFSRSRIAELMWGPLENLTSGSIVLFVAGIVLAYFVNWKLIFLYYPCAYAFLFLVNWIIDVAWNSFAKKTFKIDDKEDFYRYFDSDYIAEYYSQIDREPFMGRVERD